LGDLTRELGHWNSVHSRHRRWMQGGVRDLMPAAISDSEVSDGMPQ
jgi:hypothetical protein